MFSSWGTVVRARVERPLYSSFNARRLLRNSLSQLATALRFAEIKQRVTARLGSNVRNFLGSES